MGDFGVGAEGREGQTGGGGIVTSFCWPGEWWNNE